MSTKNAGDGQQFSPTHPFNPQSQIFGGSIGLLLVNLEADGYAVPENNDEATIAYYSFFGLTFKKIFGIPYFPNVTLRVRRFDYTGQYPYDDGQGSFVQTQTEFAKSWISGAGMPGTTDGHDGHNFVATVSALDLQNQTYSSSNNWQSANIFYNIDNQIQNTGQLYGNTLITPSLSPFEAVMTSTSDCSAVGCTADPYVDENNNVVFPSNSTEWNNFHNAAITNQTAQFIERNILNAQPVNCAGGDGLCNGTPTISGPSVICTNGQFQLVNPPSGVAINWEMENGKLKIHDGQGTPMINVSSLNTGAEIVKVTLTNACGASVVLTKGVNIGAPVITSVSSSMTGGCNGNYQDWILTANANTSVSTWHWTVDNPANSGWIVYSPYSATTLVGVTGGGGITIHATNTCGTGTNGVTIYSPCHSYSPVTASPNPATNNVTIAVAENNDAKANASTTKKMLIYKIRVIDQTGNLKKQYNYPAGVSNTIINLSGFISGMYTIQAFDGATWNSIKVIKE